MLLGDKRMKTFNYRGTAINAALEKDNSYAYWAYTPDGDVLTFDTLEEACEIINFLLGGAA